MRALMWPTSPAWWRHVRSHRGCEYAAWWCSDGWYCGGCEGYWNVDGRRAA